jgi:hypothetical protein
MEEEPVMSGSPAEAKSSCELYTLIETAANGWNPLKYLTKILQKAAAMKSPDNWGQLLPWNPPPEIFFREVVEIDGYENHTLVLLKTFSRGTGCLNRAYPGLWGSGEVTPRFYPAPCVAGSNLVTVTLALSFLFFTSYYFLCNNCTFFNCFQKQDSKIFFEYKI